MHTFSSKQEQEIVSGQTSTLSSLIREPLITESMKGTKVPNLTVVSKLFINSMPA